MTAKIIAVINKKGGVAKTTTANALGACLHGAGKKVLYIDLDPQSNLTYSLDALNRPVTSLEVLTKTATAKEAIVETKQGHLIPAGTGLAVLDSVLDGVGKEYKLKESLEPVINDYDYIIIDTAPALSIGTINALTACDETIITAQADVYSLQGITQLQETIEAIKTYCNNSLKVAGILLTRYDKRTILTREMTEQLERTAQALGTKVFDTKIRECIAVKEAQLVKESVITYSPKCNASQDYRAFTKELGA